MMIGIMKKKMKIKALNQRQPRERKKEKKNRQKKFDVHIWANRHDF